MRNRKTRQWMLRGLTDPAELVLVRAEINLSQLIPSHFTLSMLLLHNNINNRANNETIREQYEDGYLHAFERAVFGVE